MFVILLIKIFVALVKEKGSDKEKKKENEDVKDYLILKKELLVVSKSKNFPSNSIHMLNFDLINFVSHGNILPFDNNRYKNVF